MADSTLLIVVVLAIAALLLMFLRSRRSGRTPTLTPRRMAEKASEEEAAGAPKEPQWKLRDLHAGGKIHLSLPKGLEEDYIVVRRDRILWPDEQIEYDLRLAGDDPNHHVWIHWLTIGVYTHAWLLEAGECTFEDLGLTADKIKEIDASGRGSFTYRDQTYALEKTGRLTLFEGGLRPGVNVTRWDFRNDLDNRQVVVQRSEREPGTYGVLLGRELWLRDLTVIRPRAEPPNSPPPVPPAGGEHSRQT